MNAKIVRILLSLNFLAVIVPLPNVFADNGTNSSALRQAVTLNGVRAHQAELQDIADANGGTREAATQGYNDSADYVAGVLTAAGYSVSFQEFDFAFFQELSDAVLDQTSPGTVSYGYLVDFYTMDYSGSGDVTAQVQAVDLLLPPTGGSTSGCEGAFIEDANGNIFPNNTGVNDFNGFVPGKIALIQRGSCTFELKAKNAQAAGAVGVIIFNEGNAPDRTELFGGTLGGPGVNIPVVSASHAFGIALNDIIDDGLTLHLVTNTLSEIRSTKNVLASTSGREDRKVVVGAHLDSVSEGPGINDNGSGTAVILETALQMAALNIQPRNQVVFAFWGAEEAGLFGSEHYVSQLSTSQIKKIALNLNFDMLGSPNFVRYVYDGDGSDTAEGAGPNGSAVIENVFLSYFAGQNLANEATAFDGRSDYGPFIAVGIPAGGLFTGAEEIKTADQAVIYGGTAGVALDPCYHQACDDYDNNSDQALDEMADATAHAVLTFAMTTSSVNGTDKGKGKGMNQFEYRGSKLQK